MRSLLKMKSLLVGEFGTELAAIKALETFKVMVGKPAYGTVVGAMVGINSDNESIRSNLTLEEIREFLIEKVAHFEKVWEWEEKSWVAPLDTYKHLETRYLDLWNTSNQLWSSICLMAEDLKVFLDLSRDSALIEKHEEPLVRIINGQIPTKINDYFPTVEVLEKVLEDLRPHFYDVGEDNEKLFNAAYSLEQRLTEIGHGFDISQDMLLGPLEEIFSVNGIEPGLSGPSKFLKDQVDKNAKIFYVPLVSGAHFVLKDVTQYLQNRRKSNFLSDRKLPNSSHF